MFYRLPPAGNPITWCLDKFPDQNIKKILEPFNVYLYGAGAQALAAAVTAAIVTKGRQRPEVILPAYACPELVSAILYAGAKPVLADLEPKRPWINLIDLKTKITEHTVAIIAVNLFGIPERFDDLQVIAREADIYLIEDSAQYFPEAKSGMAWRGDLVILSFGRGKPVSLLGGGAVLCKDPVLYEALPLVENIKKQQSKREPLTYRLKIYAYNALLAPSLYWIPQALPFLELGETKYTPLRGIKPCPPRTCRYCPQTLRPTGKGNELSRNG